MIPFTIIIKKVTRNKFTPVIFKFYDPFYYNNQKSNKQ